MTRIRIVDVLYIVLLFISGALMVAASLADPWSMPLAYAAVCIIVVGAVSQLIWDRPVTVFSIVQRLARVFLFTGLALVFTGTIIENDFWETRLLHAGLCSMLLAGVALTFLLAGGILTIVQRVRDYLRKSRP